MCLLTSLTACLGHSVLLHWVVGTLPSAMIPITYRRTLQPRHRSSNLRHSRLRTNSRSVEKLSTRSALRLRLHVSGCSCVVVGYWTNGSFSQSRIVETNVCDPERWCRAGLPGVGRPWFIQAGQHGWWEMWPDFKSCSCPREAEQERCKDDVLFVHLGIGHSYKIKCLYWRVLSLFST